MTETWINYVNKEEGAVLSDGGTIEWPESDSGKIRRRDVHGNTEEIWDYDDDDYANWRDLFPNEALYFQPDEAGDVGCGTSAENISSYHVYRDRVNAEKAHPDCEILTFTGDDIEEAVFLDVKPEAEASDTDGWVFVDDETEEEVGFAGPDEYRSADDAVDRFGRNYGGNDFGVYFRKNGVLHSCAAEDTPEDFEDIA